ncbi:MAG: Histidine kinase [uncultured Sulfurovum sp.]|uniref:histidine kinase n=1 Tax=uncultured Sulfurovum sp. TaxID=269237 RepID=A0A6S6TDI2_9BACT|nr:MAG: Histidine kinase [uncultured Sulfurovum sp.]
MHILKYLCLLFYISTLSLNGMELSKTDAHKPLPSDATLYIDKTREVSIENIDTKIFKLIEEDQIGFGYAPDFDVWVKIEITNPYDEKMKKILEYTNPLTTQVLLYDGQTKQLLFTGGTSASSALRSINPAFPIVLKPHEHKVYYLKASSSVTTLIVGLSLWDVDTFYQNESKHQFILALFFGAMGIIILYNLFIYFSVREKVYLYYVVAFAGIIFHHLFYKGLAGLYFFTPEETTSIVKYAAFIVAIPALFLALFTKHMLKTAQYPKLDKFLHLYLPIFLLMTLLSYMFNFNNLRNLFSVILLIILFFITLYAFIKKNRQAKFIMIGWIALMSSGFLMYLSSVGYYDVFHKVPYYVETSLLIETLLFSLILADRLKQLRIDKIASQKQLIAYQAEEENRLTKLVEEKTSKLQIAIKEKDLLLQELNHRVKNSIQTIVSFLRLQVDEIHDTKMQQTLMQIENRIISISHLYSLLYAKGDISYINAYEYFSLLIENIQNTLHQENIKIELTTTITLHSEVSIYCGFIVNEAVTNALQHAFEPTQKGLISVDLVKKEKHYLLTIKDNGKGFDTSRGYDSLGLVIIESLASYQLKGTLEIDATDGTDITITWKDRDE